MRKIILLLMQLLFFQGLVFAYEKQTDEYSCGAVSAYNLIEEVCPNCRICGLDKLIDLLKTDENGTTTFNLCAGLLEYFSVHNIKADISYYGIKDVDNYKKGKNIKLKDVEKKLKSGYKAILNIGIYSKTPEGKYVRQYGHYVNLISVEGDTLKVFDPYDKENEFSIWETENFKSKLININDNEQYEDIKKHLIIETPIGYCDENEIAIINGVIFVLFE